MNWRPAWSRRLPFVAVVISATWISVSFLLEGHIGLNLADEGFLWYGTIHTTLGEVPFRDFQSYEPGRYYWGALWFKILGSDGVIALRTAGSVFQFIALSFGLSALRRAVRQWWLLAAAGFVLSVWVWPLGYDSFIVTSALYFAVLIIERPSTTRHFIAGVFVGLAAVFGRNHGLYCFLTFLALILFVQLKIDRRELVKRVCTWAAGIVVGYLPMLVMLAVVPGFFSSTMEAILFNLRVATRLSLPVPWPWIHDYSTMTWEVAAGAFSVGVLYLLAPAFYLLGGTYLLVSKHNLRRNSVLIACVFVGVGYLDYTFGRASPGYLAATIAPLLVGLMALPRSLSGGHRRLLLTIAVWAFVLLSTISVVGGHGWTFAAFVKAVAIPRYEGSYNLAYKDYGMVRTIIAGDELWVDPDTLKVVDDVRETIEQRVGPDENILIAPHWTTFYPLLRRNSPVWEIYFLFPQPRSKQEEMIGDLGKKNVNWAIICDGALDGREELRFKNSHSYMWQYLLENFKRVPVNTLPANCQLFHRE